ncbi:MAG: hypothetical protein R2752_03525 [Vicinamibacterales bacterium]
MDSLVNQLSRELCDAIAAAVAADPRVAAVRDKARAEGLDMKVTLEAVVGFADRSGEHVAAVAKPAAGQAFEMTANDRRFLKSLRISADEPTEKVD